jgi:hypothetical protein
MQNPGIIMLAAVGLGIAAVLTVRALTSPPPIHRTAQFIEDLQQRLSQLAEGSAQTLGRGVGRLGELHVDRRLNRLGHGIRNLFH